MQLDTRLITCPVCKVRQALDIKLSRGEDEVSPGKFNWVPKGELYAVCGLKMCGHVIKSTELDEQSAIRIKNPQDYSKALKHI